MGSPPTWPYGRHCAVLTAADRLPPVTQTMLCSPASAPALAPALAPQTSAPALAPQTSAPALAPQTFACIDGLKQARHDAVCPVRRLSGRPSGPRCVHRPHHPDAMSAELRAGQPARRHKLLHNNAAQQVLRVVHHPSQDNRRRAYVPGNEQVSCSHIPGSPREPSQGPVRFKVQSRISSRPHGPSQGSCQALGFKNHGHVTLRVQRREYRILGAQLGRRRARQCPTRPADSGQGVPCGDTQC